MKILLITTLSAAILTATIGASSPELFDNQENKAIVESGLIGPHDVNIECFNHGGEVNAYVQWGKNKANEVAFDNGVVLPTHDNGYDVIDGKVHVFLNEVYTLIYDNDGTYSIERDNDGHGVDIVRSGCVKIN